MAPKKDNSDELKDKVEALMRKGIYSSSSTTQMLINHAASDKSFSSYFAQLKLMPHHKYFIFLHRSDLFGIESEIQIPYFHLLKLDERKKTNIHSQDSRALQNIVSNETEVKPMDSIFSKGAFGLSPEQCSSVQIDILDVVIYYGIKIVRNSPKIRQLILDEKFDYASMKKAFGNYEELKKLVETQKELTNSQTASEDDKLLLTKLQNMVLLFATSIAKDYHRFVEDSSRLIPNVTLSSHLTSKKIQESVLKKSNLKFREYVEVLDELYRHHLIANKSTIFWCEECSLENPSFTHREGNIAPSKISKSRCLNCGSSDSYAVVFAPSPVMKDMLFAKDGILSIYFGWLLEKKRIKYVSQSYQNEYECDFIIQDEILVECKMFKSGKDQTNVQNDIENALSQLSKQLNALNSSKLKIKKVIILWNLNNSYPQIQNKLKNKWKDIFENFELEIIIPDQMENFVNGLSES